MEDEWIDGWWEAVIYPLTGDGHGLPGPDGRSLRGGHWATILTGPHAGREMHWEG
jgi:hypothetical protein